jgi:putative ABC transport system permease protein
MNGLFQDIRYGLVLGIQLLRGRAFEEQDRASGTNSIILNQALVERLFPNQEALGKTIQFHTEGNTLAAPFTVIGVTANTQNQGLGRNAEPEYYMVRRHSENDVIYNQPDSQRVSMVMRSAIGSQAVAQELRSAVATLDPTLPVEVNTLGRTVARLAERPRFSAALLSLFAIVGLLLTALGIYGVVALLVSQRSQEIGIRMALGATAKNVVGMMVWQSSKWIAAGAVAGILGSLLVARWIGALLFGVRANDPATLAEAAGLLLLVAMAGAFIPARRAAKVDPIVALRYE